MKTDNRQNGIYGEIHTTKSGMFYGKIIEVWEGYQWNISGTLDTSIKGIHHWLHGHKVPYNHISLSNEEL